jgi:Ca2+/Na+ antiporter
LGDAVAYLIGSLFGGTVIVLLIALLISMAFRSSRPTARAAKSVIGAFLVASLLAGFGFANGGPFAWWASVYYLVPAAIVFVYLQWRFKKSWVDDDAEASEAFE